MKSIIKLLMVLIIVCVGSVASAYGDEYLAPREIQDNCYYLSVNEYNMWTEYASDGYQLYVRGDLIDRNTSWNFLSNGCSLYYQKQHSIIRYDLANSTSTIVVNDDELVAINGVYKDKYLYYSTNKYGDITLSLNDLVIFDLSTGMEVRYIEDVGQMVIFGDYISTLPCCGDIAPLELTIYDADGSNGHIIANDAVQIQSLYGQLYYVAESIGDGWSDVKVQVRKYSTIDGTTKEITDYYYNFCEAISDACIIFRDYDGNVTTVPNKEVISVYIENCYLELDQPPVMVNDRVLVPLRAIFEALGAQVVWDEYTATVNAQNEYGNITLKIGSNELIVNDEIKYLDVPAQIINDRTFVPVRAISESFNYNVEWDDEYYAVHIQW